MPPRFFTDWSQDWSDWLRHDLPRLLVIVAVTFVFLRILRAVTNRLTRISHLDTLPSGVRSQQLRTLASVIYGVGVAVVLFVAFMQVLSVFNINVAPLLASAGVAGLAVGFGAQTLVKDIINGFFILIENHYDLGDTIKVAGVSGSVEAMSLRRTTLRDANGTVHIIPNSEIHVVSNLTRDWAQVALTVAVDYSENSDRVIELLKTVAGDLYHDEAFRESLVAEPEVPGIERVSGREVDYLVVAKAKPNQQWAVSRELRRRIKDSMEKNKVKAGSPAMVYMADPDSR